MGKVGAVMKKTLRCPSCDQRIAVDVPASFWGRVSPQYALYIALLIVGLAIVGLVTSRKPEKSGCVDRVFSSSSFDTFCYHSEQVLEEVPEHAADGAAVFICRCPKEPQP